MVPVAEPLEAAILRAALDPAAWAEVMTALADDIPGTATYFIGQDRAFRGSMPSAFAGYDDSAVAGYACHFQFVNPLREHWSDLAAGTICTHEHLIDRAEWLRSEFLNDWLGPQELTGAVGAILAQDDGRVFLIGHHTYDAASAACAHDTLTRLFPLFRHALDVNRALFGLRLDGLALRQGADPETAAIFVLNEAGNVTYANASGQELLASGQLVALSPTGRLKISDPDLQTRIEALLRAPTHSLRRRTGDRQQTLLADAVPVDDRLQADIGEGPLGRALSARLVLIFSRPPATEDLVARLAANLSLTPAEAQIALALAGGHRLDEIAALRGASIHTVRNQIKSALTKTGARRQSDLVLMVERAKGVVR